MLRAVTMGHVKVEKNGGVSVELISKLDQQGCEQSTEIFLIIPKIAKRE